MLALHTQAYADPVLEGRILKVLTLSEALESTYSFEQVAIDLRGREGVETAVLAEAGFAAVLTNSCLPSAPLPVLCDLGCAEVVAPGDVIRIRGKGKVSVLYRRGANANSLLVTERCNSRCLMCSQPPRDDDDGWRVNEILGVIPLIDPGAPAIAITGGEPTLLGEELARVLEAAARHLPASQLNVLTNGRLLSNAHLAERLTKAACNVLWAIPIYACTAPRHDFVVQASGAYDATLNGIYNLAERQAAIEIRIVLHRQTVRHLTAIAEFVWRTLPFVAHVAFMGLEPMGYAKTNRDQLYLDPLEYRDELVSAVWHLHDRGVHTSIYNTPLCVLPREIWPLTRQSISDWKNAFAAECDDCAVRYACSGFFASAGEAWRSRGISPIKGGMCPCPGIGENLCDRCLVGRGQAQLSS